ncbi:MAG TPA: type I polyketide synthase, partial [Pyrinomonadaceae bacterium]|nr:type I polyketide synthase [Pyrinomonadaceae bacterium]
APGVDGQSRVIAAAQALAGVDPADISYIEAHGTGTLLGDPIEISALTQAFSEATDKKQYCAIGSVKTNVGHCDAAAGVVGLIKTALCLQNRMLVPSINFAEPNPRIDFANSPFFVNSRLSEWKRDDKPLLAGLSSFGLGGTNAHAIVEEAPERAASGVSRAWQLLSLSAKTESALATATTNLKEYLRAHPETPLADVTFTANVGRTDYNYRRMVLCQRSDEAADLLENLDPTRVLTSFVDSVNRPIVFMFPGGGAQYVNMGRDLYASEPIFRQEVDRCAEILKDHLKLDIRDLLYPEPAETEAATRRLKRTSTALPALFAVEYATARLWMELGIQPQAMIGHSLGEYTAACLAGVFSLEDALALVTERGRLMDTLPSGSMVSLALPQAEVLPYLTGDLSIAAVNGPALCVVSGASSEIDSLTERLTTEGQEFRRIHIDVASHSATVEPILEEFTRFVSTLDLQAPTSPYISNVTGTWITAAQATDPRYWASHLRQTVRFADGVSELAREEQRIFLEVGPGQTLCSLVRQHPAKTPAQMVFSSIRHPHDEQSDLQFLLNTLAQLWLVGTRVNWQSFYRDEERHRVRLPTYPFERERYWIKPNTGLVEGGSLSSVNRRPNLRDWFYAPVWQQSVVPRQATAKLSEDANWLIFADDCGLSEALLAALRQEAGPDSTFTIVEAGDGFARVTEDSYLVDPVNAADYASLFARLQSTDRVPDKILHLWAVSDETGDLTDGSTEDRSFFSLLYLAQALGDLNVEQKFALEIISTGLHRISGETQLCPEKATLLGPYKVIPQEYPHITTRSIDVLLAESGRWSQQLIDQLISEFGRESADTPIAYRGSDRWLQSFASVPMEAATDGVPQLRAEGVYLITGGLGGIALELAQFLADEYRAKLILLGRSEFPAKEQWQEWLSTHDENDLV